jgi:RNA polymerase sigma-70 factor (ECF subfamily)
MARCHLRDGAEDAAAETFLRAWKGLPRYRNTGRPFGGWLYGIARHVVLDELRRRKDVPIRADAGESAGAVDQDDRLILAEAMERLPRRQRTVIEMKYVLGFSNSEVSKALRITPGAVNAVQWRGLRSLRTILGSR